MGLFWQEQMYPWPEAIKTKARCCYHMYNCRSMGKYMLDGEGFCASHYDAVWKWRHPILGAQHDWKPGLTTLGLSVTKGYEHCSVCGTTKHLQGIAQDPCGGPSGRIILMSEAAGLRCLRSEELKADEKE